MRYLTFSLILVSALAADLYSKAWAETTLVQQVGGRAVNTTLELIPGCLHLHNSRNFGSAFGILAGARWVFVIIAVVTMGVIFYYLTREIGRALGTRIVLGLLGAGVLGNLYDRIFNHDHAVRDFIDMFVNGYHWPTYNFADIYIVIGAVAVFVASFKAPEQNAGDAQGHAPSGTPAAGEG